MALTAGTRLGPYEVVAPIGVGGMGEVYRATDTNLARQVAIKVLPEAVASDPDRLARFDREAKTLAALNHSNIAAIYGLEKSNGAIALVMELVEGPTLADRIAQGAVPIDEALTLAGQIAEALEAAHERGIVHRDLKPANIKVRPDGAVKVLDFGLAKALEQTPGPGLQAPGLTNSPTITTPAMTQAGMILGTAAYMSPEQGKGREADRRSDIWAFGAVLFEMLTGERAFPAQDVAETLAAVMLKEPDWTTLPASVPPRVDLTIRRCLEKDLRRRMQSIGDVRLALDGAFETVAVVSGATLGEATVAGPMWRRALPFVATAAATGLAVVASMRALASPEPRPLVRSAHVLPAGRLFRNTARQVVTIAPDGRQFVYNAVGGLYLRALDTLEDRLIGATEAGTASPVLSPDGQFVLYYFNGRLMRVAVAGGPALSLAQTSNPFGVSWERDGTILWAQADGIWQVSENGGEASRLIATRDGEQAHGPRRLPGGDWILYTLARSTGSTRWDEAEIIAQSPGSGERRLLRKGGSDAQYVPTGHLIYAHEAVLYAVAFDVDRVEVSGEPVAVVQGVRRAQEPTTQPGTAHYAVSSNGTLVYIPGSAPRGVYRLAVVDRTGKIEPLPVAPRDYASPRVSPDGSRIAVEVTTDGSVIHIFVIAGASGIATQLTFDGTQNQAPVWTPDGRSVIFTSDRGDGDGWGIYRKAADGTGPVATLVEHSAALVPNHVSSTGVLVFEKVETGGSQRDLWTVPVNGRDPAAVFLATPAGESWARFSPDGRFLAYQSVESASETPQVYVRPYPKTDDTLWRISEDGGQRPQWAPDQKSLYFISTVGGVPQMQAAVEAASAFTRGVSRPLFDWRPMPERIGDGTDLMPTGNQFLFVLQDADPEDSESRQVVTVLNWFEELKRLVPAR